MGDLQAAVDDVQTLHRALAATTGPPDARGALALAPPHAHRASGGAGGAGVLLPAPEPLPPLLLGEVLAARRSRHRLGPDPLAPADVATLLHHALGPQRTVRLPDGGSRTLGGAPTAGGLASLDTWLLDHEGVARVVASAADAGRLRRLPHRVGDVRPFLARALDQPPFATAPATWVALVARLDRTLARYPSRHYRTLHLDAGVALQNLYLVTTALSLAGCAVMGFDDAALAGLLDLGPEAFVACLFVAGPPHRAATASGPDGLTGPAARR